ncbi:GntR family transcriptional regulator [Pusillimonas caeni]|uniref:GntR family transcriptional regulator n=1 Tax=Pusillimonas caeni TaxID=1348472 RepID=UPI000E59DB0D|nr:GntR family transcriptional regulator [Pusillimonas caeni]TFL11340.1 GntR family transcriptional regulator [Pusillimonas caeni]
MHLLSPSLSPSAIDKSLPPVEQAYQYVINGILTGELKAGTRIPTEAVAEALGISRTPVRDALRSLEGDGAVMIYANRGAVVAKYSRAEVSQLIEIRAALEGLAARFALPNIGLSELEELTHLKSRMERESSSLSKWMAAHDAFHNYLTSLSGRPLLVRQTVKMRFMLLPYYREYYSQSLEMEIFGLEHEKLIRAVELNDPTHLEQIVRRHAIINVEKVADLADLPPNT